METSEERIERLYGQAEQQASNVFRNNVPLNRYFRSLPSMAAMGEQKAKERKFEHAYLIQVKMVVLFLKYLKTHPDYANFKLTHKSDIDRARRLCQDALQTAEIVKQQLIKVYAAEAEVAKATREREEHERQAQLMKDQMWQLEAERRELESQAPLEPSAPPPPPPPTYEESEEVADKTFSTTATPTVPPRALKPEPVTDHKLKIIHCAKGAALSTLSPISVPESLAAQFLKCSSANSQRNIETCGVLFGMMIDSAIELTHVLLPKQKGTHDSCVTTNEEQILEFQEQHSSLIMLGWVHTHPDYNAFLSSVDMHNHYLYQCMMPESIAIVVSPKFNEVGTFNLTETGMKTIGACKLGGFHPHQSNPALFEPARHVHYVHQSCQFFDWR